MWPINPNIQCSRRMGEIEAYAKTHNRGQTVRFMKREYGYSIPFAACYLNERGL